jgi:hypothetical protein
VQRSEDPNAQKPNMVDIRFVPMEMPLGNFLKVHFGIGHYQLCDNQKCYGFGPGHPPKLEPQRPGTVIPVAVKDKEAAFSAVNDPMGNYLLGINDCQTFTVNALKKGGASDADIERVLQSGNLSLQSIEKGKQLEEEFKKGLF